MIEVFRTNVGDMEQVSRLRLLLVERFGLSRISFDLDDHERVLRVEGTSISPEHIIGTLCENGFECSVME